MSIKPEENGDEPPAAPPPAPSHSRVACSHVAASLAKRGLLLAITGVSLYLLARRCSRSWVPSTRLEHISPLWFAAMILLRAGSYACMWAIQKISVRSEHRGPVISSQLASNSFRSGRAWRVAAAGAMQYAMLARGVPSAAAASG